MHWIPAANNLKTYGLWDLLEVRNNDLLKELIEDKSNEQQVTCHHNDHKQKGHPHGLPFRRFDKQVYAFWLSRGSICLQAYLSMALDVPTPFWDAHIVRQ